MNQEPGGSDDAVPRRRTASPGSLLRDPVVRAILCAAVALTMAGRIGAERTATSLVAASQPSFVANPIVVEPTTYPSPSESWHSRAVERESRRLAERYVRRGYRVSPQLARHIHEAARRYDIEPELAFSLVRAESSFRNGATSPVGAIGLTQLMPRTAAWIAPGTTTSDLRDPRTNLDVGFRYLRYLLDRYDGDTHLALLAYNRGPGTVDRVLSQGEDPDNGYLELVMGR